MKILILYQKSLHDILLAFIERNDATRYGVIEEYIFDEDCLAFNKTVRVYTDKGEEDPKFQVCSLRCVRQDGIAGNDFEDLGWKSHQLEKL